LAWAIFVDPSDMGITLMQTRDRLRGYELVDGRPISIRLRLPGQCTLFVLGCQVLFLSQLCTCHNEDKMREESGQAGEELSSKKEAPPYPIESAPRDGTIFLAIDRLGYAHLVWGDERGFFDQNDGDEYGELEWWAPIPRPLGQPPHKR
jgi:hypothetical protein